MIGLDYICTLTVRWPSDALMTKKLFRATNGVIGKTSYGDGYKFDVQKGVGTGGASTVFKGEEVAESIAVDCSLTTAGALLPQLERMNVTSSATSASL